MKDRRLFLAVASSLLAAHLPASAALSQAETEFFETKIRPVLAAECYECHNAKKQKGGLRLDYRDGWKKGGDSGDAIVPGNAAKSLLIAAIRHDDPDLKMPSKAPKLDAAVIADFEAWVNRGAPDPRDEPPAETGAAATWADTLAVRRSWWSLRPVVKPAVSAVKNAAWSDRPVDRFLLATLEAKNLVPAPRADARTRLRRLTFTLTGLPPTPEEIAAFVEASARDPQAAWTAAADRLLASPRFGEHWARHWMDLVRYADTHGSEGDPAIPNAWRYRDYLIRAFTTDVPIDQLIREHLAGDLLPQPRWNRDEKFNESILGTAHLRFVEHGFQPVDTLDEQVKTVDSQIDVAMKAFQGLTVNCARCHDHKFDAISQRDYYALYGVFASCHPAMVTIDAPELLEKNRTELLALKPQIKSALATAWTAEAAKIPVLLLGERARAQEHDRRNAELSALEKAIGEIDDAARQRIVAARGDVIDARLPVPFARWSFESNAQDSVGTLHAQLEGGAEIRGGRLVVNGAGAYARSAPLARAIREKTLEAWVSLAHLDQRGGGVVSLQSSNGGVFDAIVFGERDPGHWMAGSNGFTRTRPFNGPAETARPGEIVHVATVYSADGRIVFYRNGEPYGTAYQPEREPLQSFAAQDAHVLFGLRHTGAGNGFLAGEIDEARLYDRALSAEEMAASFRAGSRMMGVTEAELSQAFTADERENRAALIAKVTQQREAMQRAQSEFAEWSAALADAAKDASSPLHPWTKLRGLDGAELEREWSALAPVAPPAPAAMWNAGGDGYSKFFRHGSGLGASPAREGEFTIPSDGARVVTGLYPASALSHALSAKHNAVLSTPRFKVASDFISVRAFGGGGVQARLIVDGYPLGVGGIFPRASIGKDEPTWITLDVKYRRGSMAYLEFATPRDLTRPENEPKDGRSWFGVERIVFHNAAGRPSENAEALAPLFGGNAPASREALAANFGSTLRAAIEAWQVGTLTSEQRTFLDYFVRRGLLPVTLDRLESARPLIAEYRRLEAEIPLTRSAPGVLEADAYDAPLLARGDHLKPGEAIPRAYLGVFGEAPFRGTNSGRLELANRLTDPKNPLTARVAANRLWHWIFGLGLVPTPDNFGRMGEKPTHPELLDYLASELIARGWSTRELVRELVTTQAFQMSSEASPAAREIDPANSLLSHFRVRRLEAESIRDSLLAVSGELEPASTGPGVEADAKRRSVYLAIRRTNLNPFLEVFDAPKPFSTLGRRDTTNVPAQSLTMLNSPFVIQRAAAWAKAEMKEDRELVEARIRRMFEKALSRPPDDSEVRAAVDFLNTISAGKNADPARQASDEALWRDFARSLFNLKEFIYLR